MVLLRAGTPAQTMPCHLVGENTVVRQHPSPTTPRPGPRAAFSFDTSGETRKPVSVRSREGWMWVVRALRPFLNAAGPGVHSCSQLRAESSAVRPLIAFPSSLPEPRFLLLHRPSPRPSWGGLVPLLGAGAPPQRRRAGSRSSSVLPPSPPVTVSRGVHGLSAQLL